MTALSTTRETAHFPVVFRADGGETIGLGHIMRCLAVAEALMEREIPCLFAATALPDAAERRLAASGAGVLRLNGLAGGDEDRAATVALAARAGAVVLDGYGFDAGYRAAVAAAGRPVLAFDDGAFTGPHPPGPLSAALVVNASPGATPADYAVSAPGARLLLGPAHAPVRREVRQAAARPLPPLDGRRSILLTFGGSDPLALTAPCIRLLAPCLPPDAKLVVVVGGGSPWLEACRAAAAPFAERVAVHYDTPAMGDLMAGAGLAVSAAGGTVAELAALAVPALLAVVADNQAPAAAVVGAAGMPAWCRVVDVRGGGDEAAARITAAALTLWNDPTQRLAMSAAARGRVDGQGAGRIAQALLEAMGGATAGR